MTETVAAANGSGELDDLSKKIIRQVEYYFGDFNLMRDTFMQEQMKSNDGWFTMDVMLKFKRLSTLCSEPSTILTALKKSKFALIEVDIEGQRIRRNPKRKIPQDNENYRTQVKQRTVFVKGFQDDENIDAINDFLSEYGRVDGVQLQRTKDKKFKGSLFATFMKKEDAEKFIEAPMVYYKCNELTKKSRQDYYEELKNTKKRKQSDEAHEEEQQDDLKGTVVVLVTGLDNEAIIHRDVKNVFEAADVKTVRYFTKFDDDSTKGGLLFSDSRTSAELLQVLEEKRGSKTVEIKSTQVSFAEPSEEDRKKTNEKFLEFRYSFSNRGNKRKHAGQHKRKQNKRFGKKTEFHSDEEKDDTYDLTKPSATEEDVPAPKVSKTE